MSEDFDSIDASPLSEGDLDEVSGGATKPVGGQSNESEAKSKKQEQSAKFANNAEMLQKQAAGKPLKPKQP